MIATCHPRRADSNVYTCTHIMITVMTMNCCPQSVENGDPHESLNPLAITPRFVVTESSLNPKLCGPDVTLHASHAIVLLLWTASSLLPTIFSPNSCAIMMHVCSWTKTNVCLTKGTCRDAYNPRTVRTSVENPCTPNFDVLN